MKCECAIVQRPGDEEKDPSVGSQEEEKDRSGDR